MSINQVSKRPAWLGRGFSALADQGLFAGAGFATNVLLARWLPPENYGAYALALSIFLFISGFHNALVLEPMSVLGPASYGASLPTYLRTVLRLHFGLTVVLAMLLGLISASLKYWAPNSSLPAALLGVSLGIPWILLFWLWRRAPYLELRSSFAVRSTAVYALTVLVLLLLFRRLSWLSPFTAFLIQALGASAACVLVSVRAQPSPERMNVPIQTVLKQHWEYGRWVIATAFVYWISSSGYYVLVGALLRIQDVAAFRSLHNLILPMLQFTTVMSLLLLPQAAASFSENGGTQFRGNTRVIVFLFGACGIAYLTGLLLLGGWLFRHLYGGRYTEFAHLLPLAALPIPLLAAAQGFSIALRAMRGPGEILLGHTVSGTLTILMGLALTYSWGLGGALLSQLISSLVFMIVIAHRYSARLKKISPVEAAEPSAQRIGVAWLMPSLERGHYWQSIFREFTKLFPNTVIFTGLWPGYLPGFEGTFSVRRLRGLKFVTLKRGTAGYESGLAWLPPFSIVKELVRFCPQIIFVGGFNLWTLYGLFLKPLTRSRIVLLLDGISPATGYLHAPIRLGLRRLIARFFDVCVSNTDEGVQYLRCALGVPAFRLRQHPYEVPCISLLNGHEGSLHLSKSCAGPTFLCVGQLIRRKGIENFLRACSVLRQRGLFCFSIVVVGDGEQGVELQDLAGKLGLEDQIHWVGSVKYEDLGAYYRACDVLVFPTQEDIWGVVPLEAMAFGKPILCSKYAGSREMIIHGRNGFVFDPHDPQELAQFMTRFMQEPALIERFGSMSKQIIAPYTPQSAAEAFATMVSSVLNP